MSKWQPIETAPKDGTEILLSIPLTWNAVQGRVGTGRIIGSYWFENGSWQNRLDNWIAENSPTHWMPLPEPPE